MSIADQSIKVFLEEIASKPGTPAGGSVAGLCGASAAAMAEMALRHTIKKTTNPVFIEDLKESVVQCTVYRNEFLFDMDRDTLSYKRIVKIMKRESDSDEDKRAKNEELQNAYKEAVEIPLNMILRVMKLMKIVEKIIDKGNKNYLSDGAAAYLVAKSTLDSLIYHIKFNLIFMEDTEYVKKITKEMGKLSKG